MESKQHLGIRIVEMLAAYERTLEKYYRAVSQKCPEGSAFFSRMADAEAEHVRKVDTIAARVRDGAVSFRVAVVTAGHIERSVRLLDEAIEHVSTHGVSYDAALAKALAVETALTEDRFYQCFEDEPAETCEFKKEMICSVAQQVKRVQAAIAEARGRQGPPPPTLFVPQ